MFTVHLVDDKHPAYAALYSVLEGLLRTHVEAGNAADHDAGGFHYPQRANHFTDKIKVTGYIDDVEHLVIPVNGGTGSAHGALAANFFGLEVRGGGSVFHFALTVNNAGSVEHCLRKGGFALAAMTHEGDIPNVTGQIIRHDRCLL